MRQLLCFWNRHSSDNNRPLLPVEVKAERPFAAIPVIEKKFPLVYGVNLLAIASPVSPQANALVRPCINDKLASAVKELPAQKQGQKEAFSTLGHRRPAAREIENSA
ncbi:MAG: hypothetical protein IPJ48_12160 [Propionivibrio sp.]|uniref:Uncharacterized protein n=1 Tax=Candidatus Propionivibrio dominans TaxID=2954373 RepID=A0A9D7FCE5_9RHOO|nr:hypothetical protein [Candidatus Propionivibrio dominans]